MRRFSDTILACAVLMIASPAFASDYVDALECGTFMSMASLEVPKDAYEKVQKVSIGWFSHARRVAPLRSDQDADQARIRSDMFARMRNSDAAERAAWMASLGQRCQTVPNIADVIYPEETCGAFALAKMKTYESTVQYLDDHAKPGDRHGSAESISERRRTAKRNASKARSILKAYTDSGRAYPQEDGYRTSGEDAEAMLDSCVRSLGVK
ncbi:MAG: hypothetical protein WBF53_04390 [Litorimonas sp.]